MSKLSTVFKEFFYAWGDNDPKKEVFRYGKFTTLEKLYGYDDYVYYRPRRQIAGGIIIFGSLGLIRLSVKGVKAKYNKRKTDKENQ
jgi:hypothetical protein